MLYKLLKKAQKERWAIGQFNFSTLEQLKGIVLAAKKLSSPVILGTSEREVEFLGLEETLALVRILERKFDFPLFLHLDHGKDLKLIKRAIDFGFDSIHFDGSFLSFKENVKLTKRIVSYARKKKVLVEGEIEHIKGEGKLLKKRINIKKEELTNPKEAQDFIKKTAVDSLAVSLGNVHGVYQQMPKIDFERLKEIRKMTNVFLVLHGGSGLPEKDLKKAIKSGIQKLNFNTELRLFWKNALYKALKESKEIKPYLILPRVNQALEKKVEKYIRLLGSLTKLGRLQKL